MLKHDVAEGSSSLSLVVCSTVSNLGHERGGGGVATGAHTRRYGQCWQSRCHAYSYRESRRPSFPICLFVLSFFLFSARRLPFASRSLLASKKLIDCEWNRRQSSRWNAIENSTQVLCNRMHCIHKGANEQGLDLLLSWRRCSVDLRDACLKWREKILGEDVYGILYWLSVVVLVFCYYYC